MSIDFTPGIINTYHGDIYNCTTNTDNAKTPDTPKWPCDNWEEQQPINSTFSGEGYTSDQYDLAQHHLRNRHNQYLIRLITLDTKRIKILNVESLLSLILNPTRQS